MEAAGTPKGRYEGGSRGIPKDKQAGSGSKDFPTHFTDRVKALPGAPGMRETALSLRGR